VLERVEVQETWLCKPRSNLCQVVTDVSSLLLQLERTDATEDHIARVIQTFVLKKMGVRCTLGRIPLLERIQLELKMLRGLRLLLLCACLFGVVVYADILEKRPSYWLGLLNTYTSIFDLRDESLAGIKTPDDLFLYFTDLSAGNAQCCLQTVLVYKVHSFIYMLGCGV